MSRDTTEPQGAKVVGKLSHGDVLKQTVDELARRGFEPVLLAFQSSAGEVEILSRKIDVPSFTTWLATAWAPSARDLARGRERGH